LIFRTVESSINLAQRVLFEDNHLLIIQKLPSEIVQGDKTGDQPLVELAKEYIQVKYKKPGAAFLGVVHRIDRPVSGAVIFARTSKALARMNAMFQNKELKKTYWALVENAPKETAGTLIHFLKKNEGQNKSYSVEEGIKNALRSVLHYKMRSKLDNYAVLEIELETGRHHQIRAQLAAIGCPIKGDVKYGARRPNADKSISLVARNISFKHPVNGELISVSSPLPDEKIWRDAESNSAL
jgi:23S rRNA pseudouridine1911/1915/1917 synthase